MTIKGAIYSQIEDIKVIDITNHIEPFNIQQAAHILRNCIQDYPKGTVHVISIDDELSIDNEHLAIMANNHYFIGPDNGVFSLIFSNISAEKIGFSFNDSQSSAVITSLEDKEFKYIVMPMRL